MRDVVYEREFDEQLARIEPRFERADQFLAGIEWVLARNPRAENCVDRDGNIWHIPLLDIFKTAYAAYYTFNDQKVFMLAIRVADDYFDSPD